jgi:outer membrane protein assembly factor BamB
MKRKLAWVVAGLVGIAIAIVAWRMVKGRGKPKAFIDGMQAIDDKLAAVTWRANYESGPSRGWIGVIDREGALRWEHELPDVATSVGGNGAIAVGDGVVSVRYSHGEKDHAVAAFALDDGKPLADYVLAAQGGGSTLPLYFSRRPTASRVLDTTTGALYSSDPRSGKVEWSRPIERTLFAPTLVGDRLLLKESGKTHVFDLRTGAETVESTPGIGCKIGDDFITFTSDADGTALVAWRGGDPKAQRVLAKPFPSSAANSYVNLTQCGRYRDRLVLTVQVGSLPGRTSVIVADAAGTMQRTIDLLDDMHWNGPASMPWTYPESAALAGELTRFVPYVLSTYQPEHKRLVMLDLEEGKIAWQAPDDDSIIHFDLFRVGTRWVLVEGVTAGILAVFDGATGHLVAATNAHHYNGMTKLLPPHAAGDVLWLSAGVWNPLDKPPIAVLDVATLKPSFVRDVELHDVTEDVRKTLGAP